MKKIVLVSVGALLTAMPAMATPSHTSNSFPNDEYMLEDYTYTNQATYANMGVYSGSVNVTADYTNNEYNVVAGTYLPAASETVTTCPANSFCPGLTGPTYYDATNAQGATACSTLSGGYNSSAAGASAETDCYKACTTASVAHSTAVTGNDYYGAGTDTCSATTCENGWHLNPGVPDLNATIGSTARSGYGYISNSYGGDTYNQSAYGLTEQGTFAVEYGDNKGIITGRSQCSSQSGTNNDYTWSNPTISSTLPNSSGRYCYCTLDSYTPVGSETISLSIPWIFRNDRNDNDNCGGLCAYYCADALQGSRTNDLAFRTAVFDMVSPTQTTCAANVITINWTDVDPEYAGDNDEGTVTFGGDIRTPRAAVSKPGKTFVGWKFVKPSGN